MTEHIDVLVIGAGISGIGAGYYLSKKCPDRTYAILEGRQDLGGTWDLFRYPGIRSDSDMYTLGYSFRPWPSDKAIADGPSILRYLRETAQEYGIDKHIRYGHFVTHAAWDSENARWTLRIKKRPSDEEVELTCSFLFMCSGYYSYKEGYTPDFAGVDRFGGRIVHPQDWTDDIAYDNKRVVVIGSGATAVTLVPEMAKKAAHVTMLQRSPTYVVSRPASDPLAQRLRGSLPVHAAYEITRWKNILFSLAFYKLSRRAPKQVKRLIMKGVRKELGDDYDVDTHFNPRYNPWDQRLCLVPDADLFDAIRTDQVEVVTDHIETFTEKGLLLRSGKELEADLVVTATGLKLEFLGGVEFEIDGAPANLPDKVGYKGMMLTDVPNMAWSFGYTNASWTLKSDLTGQYVCRLLNHMRHHGYDRVVPRLNDRGVDKEPFVDFSSGYIQRALEAFPSQGSKRPYRVYQNYLLDLLNLRFGRLTDDAVEFGRKTSSR